MTLRPWMSVHRYAGEVVDNRVDTSKRKSSALVLLPVWGLASAGGAVGFFAEQWLLPMSVPGGWLTATCILGGVVVGLILGRRRAGK